jgi:chromosome segregation ATPase
VRTAAKLTSEAAASAERDTAKAALTTAYAERDRLQAESERQRADLEAQTAQRLARETEFATKLAEAARQAGEAKQIADTMREANERLRLEIEKTENRSSTDLSRVERKATETRKMAESLDRELHNARERVTELAGQLEESRSAERNLFDRAETEAAMAEGNARRWNQEREELIGLVKAAKNAVQNAKVARESDLQRIAELEGQLTILKSLKSGA